MRFLSGVLLLALTLSACSDSGSPASPPPANPLSHELRPYYYWTCLENGDPDLQETRRDMLVVRFRDGVTDEERATILLRYDLTTIVSEHPLLRQTVVGTKDAFATAPKLWREEFIESVGPVFDFHPDDPDCGLTWPNNTVILAGDRSDPSVVSALHKARAILVNEIIDSGLYALPWDDPNNWFDFCNEVDELPAVDYADPNLIYQVCPTRAEY